jgi:hypothetical protein
MMQSQVTDILDAARLLEANGVEFTEPQLQQIGKQIAYGLMADLALAEVLVKNMLMSQESPSKALN